MHAATVLYINGKLHASCSLLLTYCGCIAQFCFYGYRILELGFGKAIEEILDFLGSRKIDSDNKEDKGKKPCKLSRQNLLLSATLNEKVNHLANISLLNPTMIGLDEKKIASGQPNPSIRKFSAIESDVDEESECPNTLLSHSSESYNLPTQLIQRYAKGDNILPTFFAFLA